MGGFLWSAGDIHCTLRISPLMPSTNPAPQKPAFRPVAPSTELSTWGKIKLLLKLKDIYNSTIENMKITSWKSKLGGLLLGLAPIVKVNAPAAWQWVGDAMLTIGGFLLAGGRDNTTTSEDVGAAK